MNARSSPERSRSTSSSSESTTERIGRADRPPNQGHGRLITVSANPLPLQAHDPFAADRARHGDGTDRREGTVTGHAELVDDPGPAGLHVQEPAAGRRGGGHGPGV